MKNGYKIKWTEHALFELKLTFEYLEENWTERELRKILLKYCLFFQRNKIQIS